MLLTLFGSAAALRVARTSAASRAAVCLSAAATPFTPNAPRDGGTISEPEAQWALANMLQRDVEIDTAELKATVPTTFIRPAPLADGPLVLFLHGADFSCLEWRLLLRPLLEAGVDCVAIDWYSGGWTARPPLSAQIEQRGVAPWTAVREHLLAFWRQELGSRPLVLVGASLGGAVALDVATTNPEMVEKLALIDAGGESFKAPPPDQVSALAAPVLAVKGLFQGIQARCDLPHDAPRCRRGVPSDHRMPLCSVRLPDDQSRIVSLHRDQPGCYEASLLYLKAGSMARRVDQSTVKRVPQPTLVVWGSEDDILPLSDAYAFQRDLPDCVGVREVEGSGHSPHLDNPEAVLTHLEDFVL